MESRRAWLPRAIECFQSQTYFPRELIIVGDWNDRLMDVIPADPHIYLTYAERRDNLGDKRNLACTLASGAFIAHWDDDDFSAPGRLADQIGRLIATGKAVTGYHTLLFRDFNRTKLMQEDGSLRPTSGWWKWTSRYSAAAGTSLCFRRNWWERHPFPSVHGGEDDRFWAEAQRFNAEIAADGCKFMYATNHRGNFSRRLIGGIEWEELPGDPYEPLSEPRVSSEPQPLGSGLPHGN